MKFFRALVLAFLVPATALAWIIHVPNRLAPRLAASAGSACAVSAGRVPTTGYSDPNARLRVFAIGYRIDITDAESYDTWRQAMRCLVETEVLPYRKAGVPTLAVFPEDIGLPTLAVGVRGATVRAQAQSPLGSVSPDVPLGMAAALAQLNVAYAPQIAAYQSKFPLIDVRKQTFLAATDTFVRAFSKTFSDIAMDYGIYVVAGNNQAKYRVTHNPLEVALYADPAVLPTDTAYVATDSRVTNTTFLWGPSETNPGAPPFERNLLARNEKVPLTAMETDILGLDAGPATGPAALANVAPAAVAGFRLGFATSLPAFQYGYPFGQRPAGLDACADLTVSYVPCQDQLGADVMIQADANPGMWATAAQSGGWQPLEWMGSTWRAVADPTVRFRYNVTPMMTGNLFDLVFDGQSAITGRDKLTSPKRYIGNATVSPTDPAEYAVYAGGKSEFLALSPWATGDASREQLAATAGELVHSNAYVESVIFADLS